MFEVIACPHWCKLDTTIDYIETLEDLSTERFTDEDRREARGELVPV
jgi:hypothetical protein